MHTQIVTLDNSSSGQMLCAGCVDAWQIELTASTTNHRAVELHLSAYTSSDLSFTLEIIWFSCFDESVSKSSSHFGN